MEKYTNCDMFKLLSYLNEQHHLHTHHLENTTNSLSYDVRKLRKEEELACRAGWDLIYNYRSYRSSTLSSLGNSDQVSDYHVTPFSTDIIDSNEYINLDKTSSSIISHISKNVYIFHDLLAHCHNISDLYCLSYICCGSVLPFLPTWERRLMCMNILVSLTFTKELPQTKTEFQCFYGDILNYTIQHMFCVQTYFTGILRRAMINGFNEEQLSLTPELLDDLKSLKHKKQQEKREDTLLTSFITDFHANISSFPFEFLMLLGIFRLRIKLTADYGTNFLKSSKFLLISILKVSFNYECNVCMGSFAHIWKKCKPLLDNVLEHLLEIANTPNTSSNSFKCFREDLDFIFDAADSLVGMDHRDFPDVSKLLLRTRSLFASKLLPRFGLEAMHKQFHFLKPSVIVISRPSLIFLIEALRRLPPATLDKKLSLKLTSLKHNWIDFLPDDDTPLLTSADHSSESLTHHESKFVIRLYSKSRRKNVKGNAADEFEKFNAGKIHSTNEENKSQWHFTRLESNCQRLPSPSSSFTLSSSKSSLSSNHDPSDGPPTKHVASASLSSVPGAQGTASLGGDFEAPLIGKRTRFSLFELSNGQGVDETASEYMDRLSMAAAVSDKTSSSLPSEYLGGPSGSRSNLDLLDVAEEIPESFSASSSTTSSTSHSDNDDLNDEEGLFHRRRRRRNQPKHPETDSFNVCRSHSQGGDGKREHIRAFDLSSSAQLSDNTYWSRQSRMQSFLLQEHSSVDAEYPSTAQCLPRSHSASELTTLQAREKFVRPGGGTNEVDISPKPFRRISVPSPPQLHRNRSGLCASGSSGIHPPLWLAAEKLNRIVRNLHQTSISEQGDSSDLLAQENRNMASNLIRPPSFTSIDGESSYTTEMNDDDAMSDRRSSVNFSGRVSPSMTSGGRVSPLSTISGSGASRNYPMAAVCVRPAQGGGIFSNLIQTPSNPTTASYFAATLLRRVEEVSDVTERFGKFELPNMRSHEHETWSMASEAAWSTDVIPSDTESVNRSLTAAMGGSGNLPTLPLTSQPHPTASSPVPTPPTPWRHWLGNSNACSQSQRIRQHQQTRTQRQQQTGQTRSRDHYQTFEHQINDERSEGSLNELSGDHNEIPISLPVPSKRANRSFGENHAPLPTTSNANCNQSTIPCVVCSVEKQKLPSSTSSSEQSVSILKPQLMTAAVASAVAPVPDRVVCSTRDAFKSPRWPAGKSRRRRGRQGGRGIAVCIAVSAIPDEGDVQIDHKISSKCLPSLSQNNILPSTPESFSNASRGITDINCGMTQQQNSKEPCEQINSTNQRRVVRELCHRLTLLAQEELFSLVINAVLEQQASPLNRGNSSGNDALLLSRFLTAFREHAIREQNINLARQVHETASLLHRLHGGFIPTASHLSVTSKCVNGDLEATDPHQLLFADRSNSQLTVLTTVGLQREVRKRERRFVRLQAAQCQVVARKREVEASKRGLLMHLNSLRQEGLFRTAEHFFVQDGSPLLTEFLHNISIELSAQPRDVNRIRRLLDSFVHESCHRLLTRTINAQELEKVLECVTMQSLFVLFFQVNEHTIGEQDRSLRQCIRDLHQRDEDSMPFTIPKQWMLNYPFSLAQSELVLINLYSTPRDKFLCLQRTLQAIMWPPACTPSSTNPNSSVETGLVSVLMFIIIQVNPIRLLSNLHFIEAFGSPLLTSETTEHRCIWAHFKAAVDELIRFLSPMPSASLSERDPGGKS